MPAIVSRSVVLPAPVPPQDEAPATLPPLEKQLEQQRSLLATLAGRFPSEADRKEWTDVFVKRNGKWVAVASQTALIK